MRIPRAATFTTACVAWIASWFSPVMPGVPGWAAFRYALAPLVPFKDASTMPFEESVPQVLSALTNVVFAILAALWIAKRLPRAGLLVRIALACFLVNLYWFVKAWHEHGLSNLRFGYYLWIGAFVLLLAVGIYESLSGASSHRTSRTPTAGTRA